MFDSFPEMYKNLIKFIQTKLLVKKSEIKIGFILRPYSQSKQQRLDERVKKAIMDKDNEDLIFVSDDEDDDDDVGYNLPQKRLGNISRHTEENTKLLEESLMSE